MNSPVSQIKERLTIEEVVSSYIKLERVGSNLKAKCPFHNEKTPSFFISPDRGSYYCFGCQAKGDIFTFVEEFEGLDFKGALKLLADKAGILLEGYNQKEESVKEKLYKVMEEATLFFEDNLKNNKEAKNYLLLRGLKDETIKSFRIGFILNDWRILYSHLQKKGFSDFEIEKAGLVKKTEKGMYDRFRGRIMFPIADSSGRIIAFSGRIFIDDPSTSSGQVVSQAKYLNSPDTIIFNKSYVLYGLDKAKEAIRKNNFSILVEGQMDLILSHQAGWKNTIATSGTALSDATVSKENAISNLGLVRRLSPNIVLAFDGDKAGISATERAGKIALSLGMDVKVALMPVDTDPADLILKEGNEAWKKAIREAKHLIEFLQNKILENFQNDIRKAGREIKEKILPFVNSLSSSIEKSYFLKKISDVSNIPINALEDDLKKIEETSKYEQNEIRQLEEVANQMFRKDYILRRLLGIVLWQQTLIAIPDAQRLESRRPTSVDIDELLKEIGEILNIKVEKLLQDVENEKEDLIFEAEVFYNKNTSIEKEIQELFGNLKEEYYKEELSNKMRELNIAEEKQDSILSAVILKECQIINNKIEDLKNSRLSSSPRFIKK
ncbi:MAG: DNA primase [Patescibacteria group bacterium]